MEKIIMELNNIIKEQESILMRRRQENLHRILMQELVLRHTLRENLSVNTMDYILNQLLERSSSLNRSQTYSKESSLSSNSSFETISEDNIFRKPSTLVNESCSTSSIYNNNGIEKVLAYIQNVSSSIAASCTKAAIQTTLESSLGLVLMAYMPNNNNNNSMNRMDSDHYSQGSFENIMGLIDQIGQMQSTQTVEKPIIYKKPSYLKKSSSSLSYSKQSSRNELKSLASVLLKLLDSSSDYNLTGSIKPQNTGSTISRFDTTENNTENYPESFNTESSSLYSSDSATFLFKCIIPQLIQVNGRIELIENELLNLYQERDILYTLKSLELNGTSFNTSPSFDRFDLNKSKSLEEFRAPSLEHIIPPWMMRSDSSVKPIKTQFSKPVKNMDTNRINTQNVPTTTTSSINKNNTTSSINNNKDTTSTTSIKKDTSMPILEMHHSQSFERQLSEITRLLAMLRLDSKDSTKDILQSEESSFHLGFMNSNEWGSEELSALSNLANALKVKSEEYICSLHHKKNRRAKTCRRKPKRSQQKKQQKRKARKIAKSSHPIEHVEHAIEPIFHIPQYKMITDGSVDGEENNNTQLCIVGSGIKAEQQLPRVYQQYFISPAGFTIRILRTDSVESEE